MRVQHLFWQRKQKQFVRSQDWGVAYVPKVTVAWKRERERYIQKRFVPSEKIRELALNEVVWEYDGEWTKGLDKKEIQEQARKLVLETLLNLHRAGYGVIVFDHDGKSPHLHAFIKDLEKVPADKRKKYKELLMKKYTSDINKVDLSLAGEHLIAVEYAPHWKYGTIKREIINTLPKSIEGKGMCWVCQKACLVWTDTRGFRYCRKHSMTEATQEEITYYYTQAFQNIT